MVAWLEDGQGYWTFEDLDFEGALVEIYAETNDLMDKRGEYDWGSFEFKKLDRQIDNRIKVCQYIELLKWGRRYVV